MLYRRDNRIQARSTKNCPIFALGSSFGEPQDSNAVPFPSPLLLLGDAKRL